jgi:hypothetical protein
MEIIDTLKLSKSLQDRGVEPKLSEGIAEGMNDAMGEIFSKSATKEDLLATKEDLHRGLEDLRKDMNHGFVR